jgi:hypothetical protein
MFNAFGTSLSPRFSPVTLTPFTMLIPTIPEIDDALNMLFMKFGEPKVIAGYAKQDESYKLHFLA